MQTIQPHYHAIARTAQDYERMAMSGVVAVAVYSQDRTDTEDRVADAISGAKTAGIRTRAEVGGRSPSSASEKEAVLSTNFESIGQYLVQEAAGFSA